MKYYILDKTVKLDQALEVAYYEADSDQYLAVVNTDEPIKVLATYEKQFEEVESILENSHFNKELNEQITKRIREKYSIDDEIALINKGGQAYEDYQAFRQSIVDEFKQIKIKYGLKK